jgi:hypothetical protein
VASWTIAFIAFVGLMLWLSTQPPSHNGPCAKVAHDEVCG